MDKFSTQKSTVFAIKNRKRRQRIEGGRKYVGMRALPCFLAVDSKAAACP